MFANIGAVVIGRNEGERLVRCLETVRPLVPRVVYVDSGSSDDSIQAARQAGADVVILDTSQGFTAARARNAGWRRLAELAPDVQLVQFVDGDCCLDANWLCRAAEALRSDRRLAVACGRLRELAPEQSIYNRLCDLEWNTPVGDVQSCGGIAMMRLDALRQVDGFNDRLIAGEEPELCVRLRGHDWRIRRLDAEMAQHDAAMTRFGQWWCRARRSGHAFAEAAARHGGPPEWHGVRPSLSIWFWGLIWPALTVLLVVGVGPLALLTLLAYPLLALKIARSRHRRFADPWAHCLLYGTACVVGKWPQLAGQIGFLVARIAQRDSPLIEYKGKQVRI